MAIQKARSAYITPSMTSSSRAASTAVRISRKKYGFRLLPGNALENHVYSINIQGKQFRVSDDYYVRIECGDFRVIYLATHHNAAYLFSVISSREGRLHGHEDFFHIDQSIHPDNAPIGINPSLTARINVHRRYLTSKIKGEIGPVAVNEGNYITALNNLFPNMKFVFLHDGRNSRSWGGMNFNQVGTALNWPTLNRDNVASIDLDIFRGGRLTPQKMAKLIKDCKIIMLFLSPKYIWPRPATDKAEKIIAGLIS